MVRGKALGFVLVCAITVQQGSDVRVSAQSQTFRGDAQSVLVYASVTDKTGHFVTDLTRDNFEVNDNGRKQTLTAFSTELQPLTAVLMLDRSGAGSYALDLERGAALEFIYGLTAADRVRIGTFAATTRFEPTIFTNDRIALAKALQAETVEAGPTPLWNAAAAAIDALANETGRRVLMLFTDGTDSPDPTPDNITLAALKIRAEQAGVTIYTVGVIVTCSSGGVSDDAVRRAQRGGGGQGRGGGGRGGGGRGGRGGRGDDRPCMAFSAAVPDPGLKDLAASSGGVYTEMRGAVDMATTFRHLSDELHHQYLLAFTPAVLDNKEHAIKVKLPGRSGLTVRARASYFAGVSAGERETTPRATTSRR